MWEYTLILILIVIPGVFFQNKNHELQVAKIDILPKIHMVLCFSALFALSSFRGDFTSDYNTYVQYFNLSQYLKLGEVLNLSYYFGVMETGYAILNILLRVFTGNYLWIFIVTTLIILVPIFNGINEDSEIKWFSILLFVVIGFYYESFNVVRNVAAASLVFLGAKHLYRKEYFKYLLFVLLGCMFHVSAIFVAGLFFLLLMKPNLKSVYIYIIIGLAMYISIDIGMKIVDTYLFNGYYTSDYTESGLAGIKITNMIVPLAIGLFAVWNRKLLDIDNMKHRVWFNGTLLWVVFKILTVRLFLITRLAMYFSPFMILLIPALVTRIKNRLIRTGIILALTLLIVIFFYKSYVGSGYDPYYTIWDK